ncbi:hypothetical protein [Thalassotalea sediminis]|uniref:hypothetical protein n=1 Tax=Thalassotalea sediminis TaxID=1759089 RepID=UPI002573016B|nr:hypothetical protein [Thalassotalea sediminis]
MKKVFRFLLLLTIVIALFVGVATKAWDLPIGVIALSTLCLIVTFAKRRASNSTRSKTDASVISVVGSSSASSSADCGSSGADGGC